MKCSITVLVYCFSYYLVAKNTSHPDCISNDKTFDAIEPQYQTGKIF